MGCNSLTAAKPTNWFKLGVHKARAIEQVLLYIAMAHLCFFGDDVNLAETSIMSYYESGSKNYGTDDRPGFKRRFSIPFHALE